MKLPGQYPFWGLLWRGTKKGQQEQVYIMYGLQGPLQFWRKKDAEAHARQVYGDGRVLRALYSKWSRPKAVKVAVEFTIRDGK